MAAPQPGENVEFFPFRNVPFDISPGFRAKCRTECPPSTKCSTFPPVSGQNAEFFPGGRLPFYIFPGGGMPERAAAFPGSTIPRSFRHGPRGAGVVRLDILCHDDVNCPNTNPVRASHLLGRWVLSLLRANPPKGGDAEPRDSRPLRG